MSAIVSKINNNDIESTQQLEEITINTGETLALGMDCSSTCTGLCVTTVNGKILYTIAFIRDKGDDFIRYKVKLKSFLVELFRRNPNLIYIFYEEPFMGFAESSKVLIALHTLVKEIQYENTPEFDYIEFREVSNQRWKKLFLFPTAVPSGTDAQKAYVRAKLELQFPYFKELTQDEVDASAMALVCTLKLLSGNVDEVVSHKKLRPFKFKIQFIASDTDQDMLRQFANKEKSYKIPKALQKEFYPIIELSGRGDFKTKVCEAIGEEDRLVIVKYKSDKYGNITLEYEIGKLAASAKNLYAIVWRVQRKK